MRRHAEVGGAPFCRFAQSCAATFYMMTGAKTNDGGIRDLALAAYMYDIRRANGLDRMEGLAHFLEDMGSLEP